MSTEDDQTFRSEVHQGHDLEAGLLQRVREWTDLFPWIRLANTLRVAGSPPMVGLAAIALLVWSCGMAWIVGEFTSLALYAGQIETHWQITAAIAWSLLVWAPAAIALARQGALLTAGRPLYPLRLLASHTARRSIWAWIASVVPLGCVLAVGLAMVVIGWIARLSGDLILIEFVLAAVAAVIAIPCGILGFGATLAVPLGWAAIANEPDPDPLDALSRGYESLYRRPLRVTLYLALAAAMLAVICGLAWGIAQAASFTSTQMLALSGCPPTVPRFTSLILQQIPLIVGFALLWSLVGGIYLLLRYDTGGQEVEDLWFSPPTAERSLPDLPS